MKSVSQAFIDEQEKFVSGKTAWEIIARAGTNNAKDLTPYLVANSLNRLEWAIEDTLNIFVPSDIQLNLVYDEALWQWIQANENIEVTVKRGFPFEMIERFWGYLDKLNMELNSDGTIYLRCYSFLDSLGARNYSSSFPHIKLSLEMILRDIYENQLQISDYTIEIKPLTLEPASDYILSLFTNDGLLGAKPDALSWPFLRISDHIFAAISAIRKKIRFYTLAENYSTTTFTDIAIPCSTGETPVEIIEWSDNKFAIVAGQIITKSFWYAPEGTQHQRSFWEATNIYIYNNDGTYFGNYDIARKSDATFNYYPLARYLKRLGNSNKFIVGYYKEYKVSPYLILNCQFETRNNTSPYAVSNTININNYYPNPAWDGVSSTTRYNGSNFFCFFSPYGATVNPALYIVGDSQYVFVKTAPAEFKNLIFQGRRMAAAYHIIALEGALNIYDMANNNFTALWPYAPLYLKGRSYSDKAYLSYWNRENNILITKVCDWATGSVTTASHSNIIDQTAYENGYEILSGFGFAFNNENYPLWFAIGQLPGSYMDLCLYGNLLFPFSIPDESKTLKEYLEQIAMAWCAVNYIPNKSRASFISRDFLSQDSHLIPDSLILRENKWQIGAPKVVVVGGVSYGSGVESIEIEYPDFMPDDNAVKRTIAKNYYNFLYNNNAIITFSTDFLIQYELLDILKIKNPLDNSYYQGRIMKTVDEDNLVEVEMRGRKI